MDYLEIVLLCSTVCSEFMLKEARLGRSDVVTLRRLAPASKSVNLELI